MAWRRHRGAPYVNGFPRIWSLPMLNANADEVSKVQGFCQRLASSPVHCTPTGLEPNIFGRKSAWRVIGGHPPQGRMRQYLAELRMLARLPIVGRNLGWLAPEGYRLGRMALDRPGWMAPDRPSGSGAASAAVARPASFRTSRRLEAGCFMRVPLRTKAGTKLVPVQS
jgi:hypothetical protein